MADRMTISEGKVVVETEEGTTLKRSERLLEEMFRYELVPPLNGEALPDGVKFIEWRPPRLIVVHQTPPHVRSLRWLAEDSPVPYGRDAKYRRVRLSLPYTVTFANFLFAGGRLRLTQHNELFFRTEPLRRKSDRLCYPALLNVSRIPKGKRHIAWICTQYLNCSSRMSWPEQLHALLEHLWNGAFNLSSERHEGESWYTACRSVPNLHPIEQWERESQRDDAWALNVPWLSAPISVGELIEEFLSAGETCGPLWLFSRRDTTVPIVSRFVTFSQEQGRSRRKAV